MKGQCIVCNKETEVNMCCSKHICHCDGLSEPPVCSEECYKELFINASQEKVSIYMDNFRKYYPEINNEKNI